MISFSAENVGCYGRSSVSQGLLGSLFGFFPSSEWSSSDAVLSAGLCASVRKKRYRYHRKLEKTTISFIAMGSEET